jgi:beta-lactamase class A
MSELSNSITAIDAAVGVCAEHLETGQRIDINADDLFFTASTLKVPLLVELYRQVDAGKVSPTDRVEVTEVLKTPGSGVLKEFDGGVRPTVKDLAMLMIIVSDNTATDLVYDLIGRDNVRAMLDELGLTATQIPMNVKELLYISTGLDPANPEHTFQECSSRLFAQDWRLDSDAYDEAKSDVSTPREMCALLRHVEKGDLLSSSSREAVLDILKRQQNKTVIPGLLPPSISIAHKTGGVHTVRCDVGIVYAPNGPYTVAIMAKGITGERINIDLSLAKVSKAVWDEMTA